MYGFHSIVVLQTSTIDFEVVKVSFIVFKLDVINVQ